VRTVGQWMLALAVTISIAQVVSEGEAALPLLVVSLLVAGAVLTRWGAGGRAQGDAAPSGGERPAPVADDARDDRRP